METTNRVEFKDRGQATATMVTFNGEPANLRSVVRTLQRKADRYDQLLKDRNALDLQCQQRQLVIDRFLKYGCRAKDCEQ